MVFAILAGVFVLIPITALLTEHQRKMAEIRSKASVANADRLDAMERRMSELTELVHQQTIAVDSLCGRVRAEHERIENRINA